MKYYLGLVDEKKLPLGYDCYCFAGDYCVNAIRWCKQNNKKYEILLSSDITFSDVHDKYLYLESVKNKTIKYLSNILNEYHKSEYSIYKWRILLSNWLIHFLPSLYNKYLTIQSILGDERVYDTFVFLTDINGLALDNLDFINMINDDFSFHKYEYSILLENISNHKIHVKNEGEYIRIPLQEYHANDLPQNVRDFIETYKKYKKKYCENDEMVIQSPYIKFTLYRKIIEKKYGKISGYFTDYLSQIRNDVYKNVEIDKKWRMREKNILNEQDEFVSLIYKTVLYFLPVAYLEKFKEIETIALENYYFGKKPKAVLFDAEGININEMFKIYLMNIDIENVKKIDIMHALSYNLGGYSYAELNEFQLCNDFLNCTGVNDAFINVNFVKMPFISFFRVNRELAIGNKIIYANYTYPQHKIRLSMAEWNWGYFVNKELEFLKKLDRNVISELQFRFHPYHKAQWENINRVKEAIPDIMFDCEPNFYESVRSAKLVISEILGAAAMESLGLGKPTIVLFNPIIQYVELNKTYKDVEDMIRVELIAETPDRLASIVNRIYNDVESWWNEPERQKVVKRIQDKYIYFPENAEEIWIDKITSYIN